RAQGIAQAAGGQLDIVVLQHVIPRDVPPQPTSFGETNGKQARGMDDLCVLAQSVSHVMTKPIKDLSSLEIPLRGSNHVDARCAQRRDRRIPEQRGTRNGERHLEMAKVIRPIEAIEGSRSELVER